MWVTQTITKETPKVKLPGNCLQAAVATLLGRDLDEVPHFAALEHHWNWVFDAWLHEQGYMPEWTDHPRVPDGIHLTVGRGPRGNRHVVLFEGDEMIWDPHPSRDGLLPHSTEPGHGWMHCRLQKTHA